MFARDHEDVMSGLLSKYCGPDSKVEYTQDLGTWCKDCDISAPDAHAPMRLAVTGDGQTRLCLLEVIPKGSVDDRIKALSIRWTLQNTTTNLADRLNSEKKKLAYLFLKEFAGTKPGLDDELVADNWIFEEMRKHNFFKE